MVIKFFSSTIKHPEPGGLDYVLKNPTAVVLRGNVNITRAVIESSPANMAHRFTSGVLNDTAKLCSTVEEQLLDELEIQLQAGRLRESIAWCAMRHRDKRKSEIHIIIALMDLLFWKPVNPYVDQIDRMRFAAWRDQFNLLHGLTLPSQHLRVEPPFDHLRKATEDVDFLRLVWLQVKKWVDNGDVRNRAELKVRLNASKYMVRWENNWGGPLEQPEIIGPKGRKLRLSGSIYYGPNFGLPAGIPLDLNDKEAVAKHLANLQRTIDDRMEFRAYWTIGRLYGKRELDRLARGKASERLKKLNEEKLRSMRLKNAKLGLSLAHFGQIGVLLKSGVEPKILSRVSSPIIDSIDNNPLGNPPAKDGSNQPADELDSVVVEQSELPDLTPAKDEIPALSPALATKPDPSLRTTHNSPATHAGNQPPVAFTVFSFD